MHKQNEQLNDALSKITIKTVINMMNLNVISRTNNKRMIPRKR